MPALPRDIVIEIVAGQPINGAIIRSHGVENFITGLGEIAETRRLT